MPLICSGFASNARPVAVTSSTLVTALLFGGAGKPFCTLLGHNVARTVDAACLQQPPPPSPPPLPGTSLAVTIPDNVTLTPREAGRIAAILDSSTSEDLRDTKVRLRVVERVALPINRTKLVEEPALLETLRQAGIILLDLDLAYATVVSVDRHAPTSLSLDALNVSYVVCVCDGHTCLYPRCVFDECRWACHVGLQYA